MINNNLNTPSFKARQIAQTRNILKNIETKITLYELNHKDKTFLTQLPEKIDLQKLMPNLTPQGYSRWKEMLQVGVDKAILTDRKSCLAVVENKPCGIITYKSGKKTFDLDCICTWPIEFGNKVNAGGKTLFNQMFKTFIEQKADKIKLEAITNGPFDTVEKYKDLGFIVTGGEGHKIFMETNSQKLQKTLKKLEKFIDYTPILNAENENLLNTLRL